jgi:hypothetical protein
MRHYVRGVFFVFFVAALAVAGAPRAAFADGYLSPWVGTNFGGSHGSVGSNIDNGRVALGVNAGFMGAGILGAEAAFGYSPSAFGTENDFGHNTVIDLMGNLVIGIPIGGTHGAGIRPYVSGGVGLIRTQIDGGTVFKVSSKNNDFGWDAGAGLTGYFSDHFGIRGDVRYFNDTQISDFHYWRASAGLVIR